MTTDDRDRIRAVAEFAAQRGKPLEDALGEHPEFEGIGTGLEIVLEASEHYQWMLGILARSAVDEYRAARVARV